MDEGVSDLLSRGRAAAKAGEWDEARFFLEWALRLEDGPSAERLDALYWMSEISTDPAEKRGYLEDILSMEPGNARARARLAILDGRVDPARIIDPDRLDGRSSQGQVHLSSQEARSFVCPQCGGRMTFAPDGQTLTCEFCEARERVGSRQPLKEQDFLVDMLTARAHLHSAAMLAITCQGCGASFYLLPEQLSKNCPYCDTAYVVETAQTRDLVAPSGLIPFALSAREALRSLQVWLTAHHIHPDHTVTPPQGLYIPVWAFRMGGMITWTGLRQSGREMVAEQGSIPSTGDEVLVPASGHYQDLISRELPCYDLKKVVPYDPRYLVDWPAETYQAPAATASLAAREQAFRKAQAEIRSVYASHLKDVQSSSLGMTVEAYKLLLLPAWIGRFSEEGQRCEALINGQTGSVQGHPPAEGLHGWIEKLLGE